ncbi:MAG: cupin domain-containing protein, partial [Acidobacteriaceae bacterium]|nr:cupin domain-containing protein [Acidobacteriaceae bacterium]
MEQTKLTSQTDGFGRRNLLRTGSAFLTAMFTAKRMGAQDIQKMREAQHNESATNPGPENKNIQAANPNTFLPPPTDHGEVQTFWATFSASHRRIQPGGWSRQVTVEDFPISKDIAGVNMRLTAGGIRELHWHNAAEWALMLRGKARITAIDNDGRSAVKDVGVNDLWFFPTGTPHSIQGLAPDGCEFVLVFDDGKFSEGNTTLISDWTRHTPREVLAKNWGVPEEALDPVYSVPADGHYIFQQPVPPPLEEDQRAAAGAKGSSPIAFDFAMHSMPATFKTKFGEVRVIDSRNFPVSTSLAAAHVVVKPGGLRELHWHQNADEWQYYVEGKGRMTVFFNGGKARTADFNAGDVGYVPKTLGHYIENTGDTDLIFIEMFKA